MTFYSMSDDPDFQHGYQSGVDGVQPDHYESYLSSRVSQDWLAERIDAKQQAIQRIEQAILETTAHRKTAYDTLQQHLLKGSVLGRQVSRLEADRAGIDQEQAALVERRERAAPEYSLLAGLLFLVAGISFLLGDLVISHEIVAYALHIRDNTEAWTFAVGLAMVSILLKPAYDRLIEQPFQRDPGRYRTKYEYFKLALALFAVLTLAVLGWFRYEAYRTDQLKAAINKSIRQLQVSAQPPDLTGTSLEPLNPAVFTQIEKQLRESDTLNLALVNSPWALLSFVLSGILFALAGAVCLGIALPVLVAYWFRWLQADVRRGTLRRRLKRLNRNLVPAEQELTEHLTCTHVLENFLTLLPNLAELRQEKLGLQQEVEQWTKEAKLAQTDSRIAAYNDGYAKGIVTRENMTDEEYRQSRTPHQLPAKTSNPAEQYPPLNGYATPSVNSLNGK